MQDEELKNNKYYQEYLELKEYNEELAEIFLQGLIQDRDISIESKYTAEDIVPSKRGLSGCFISGCFITLLFILSVIVLIITAVLDKLNN